MQKHKFFIPSLIFIIAFIIFLIITNAVNYTNGTIIWTLGFTVNSLFTTFAMIEYIIISGIVFMFFMLLYAIKSGDRY